MAAEGRRARRQKPPTRRHPFFFVLHGDCGQPFFFFFFALRGGAWDVSSGLCMTLHHRVFCPPRSLHLPYLSDIARVIEGEEERSSRRFFFILFSLYSLENSLDKNHWSNTSPSHPHPYRDASSRFDIHRFNKGRGVLANDGRGRKPWPGGDVNNLIDG